MIGRGHAWSAISFVNALPTGTGAAAAIALKVEAQVSIQPQNDGPAVTADPGPANPLVIASVEAARRALRERTGGSIHVAIHSDVPAAKGLKSSSAVSVAIIRAVADALGERVDARAAARLASDVGLSVGGSATGAYDDASASALGGLVATQNGPRVTLRHASLDPSWSLLLWVPQGGHGPSMEWGARFRARASEGALAVEALLGGDLLRALERNTTLVESVMGYPYAPLRQRLAEAGALGAGVSGLGPALAVIVGAGPVGSIAAELPRSGAILKTEFVPPGPQDEGASGN